MSDWRVDNAKWTRGAVLRSLKYVPPKQYWDHDHCEGWAKLMQSDASDIQSEGYVTEDSRWICAECFHDLHEEMGWKLA